MNRCLARLLAGPFLIGCVLIIQGCGSSGSTYTGASYHYYSGYRWNDPYSRYPCCRDGVVVPPRRPPGQRSPSSHSL